MPGKPNKRLAIVVEKPRPHTRGECRDGVRPCPYYGCRHHLGLDVDEATGAMHMHHLAAGADTCSLDVAERIGASGDDATLAELAAYRTATERTARRNLIAGLTSMRAKMPPDDFSSEAPSFFKADVRIARGLPQCEPAPRGSGAGMFRDSSPNRAALLDRKAPTDMAKNNTPPPTSTPAMFAFDDDVDVDCLTQINRDPELARQVAKFARASGVTPENIRDHGPRTFVHVPNLRELIDNTESRGERYGTGR